MGVRGRGAARSKKIESRQRAAGGRSRAPPWHVMVPFSAQPQLWGECLCMIPQTQQAGHAADGHAADGRAAAQHPFFWEHAAPGDACIEVGQAVCERSGTSPGTLQPSFIAQQC